jgi:hypothetical protein
MFASILPFYAGVSAVLFTWYDTIVNLLLVMCQSFGIIYVEIYSDYKMVRAVLKALRNDIITSSFSYKKGNILPSGIILGRQCVGSIKSEYGDEIIRLFGFKEYIMNVITQDLSSNINDADNSSDISLVTKDTTNSSHQSSIKIYSKTGDYKTTYYTYIKYPTNNLVPRGDQKRVVDSIVELYRRKKRGTVFLSGPSGVGKTIVSLLVAKEIGACYTHSFAPSEPGDTLAILVSCIQTNNDEEAPIIVVIEEADKLIENIHEGTIAMNTQIPILVHNKSTFNTFLDDMMLYHNVILIMTSNKSVEDINAMDPSYLRSGRVHAHLTMSDIIKCDD